MEQFETMLVGFLMEKGVPEDLAETVASFVVDMKELMDVRTEVAHAQTFLAYVQAGVALLSVEDADPRFLALGKEVLDVASAMFEGAMSAEESEGDAGAEKDPSAGGLDPSILT